MNDGLDNALRLIEYQRLDECWAVYCYKIDSLLNALIIDLSEIRTLVNVLHF